jgi:hypothetical protein
VDALSARARIRLDGRTSDGAITAAAGLDAACQQLSGDWHQGVGGEDLDHALALLDALQQGLAARGFSWRDLLKTANTLRYDENDSYCSSLCRDGRCPDFS